MGAIKPLGVIARASGQSVLPGVDGRQGANFLGLRPRESDGGTLYIRRHHDLVRRIYEHRTDAVPGFTNNIRYTDCLLRAIFGYRKRNQT